MKAVVNDLSASMQESTEGLEDKIDLVQMGVVDRMNDAVGQPQGERGG